MKRERLQFLLLFLLLAVGVVAEAQEAVVRGYVRDSDSGEPLAGAGVFIVGGNMGQSTDRSGFFEMRLPAGRPVDVRFSYVGYATAERRVIPGDGETLEVALERSNRLFDVQVTAARRDFGVDDSQMSASVLTAAKIKSIPSLMGEHDVMKALQRLPGVQSGAEGSSGIYVRGGNFDQNLVTLDGVTLYNTDHLKGFVSAINADMVDRVTFYKGAFPARFGSRLSSVVDVGLKEGDYRHYHASLTAGLLSSRIQAEGPIWKGRTSFNVAARASYFDAIVQPVLEKISDDPMTMRPYAHMNYYDLTAKLSHRFSENDRLTGMFYWSRDEHNTAPSENRLDYSAIDNRRYISYRDASTRNNWGNILGGLRWTHLSDSRFESNVALSYSHYDSKMKMAVDIQNENYRRIPGSSECVLQNIEKDNSYAMYRSKIDEVSLTADFRKGVGQSHDFRWGADVGMKRLSPTVETFRHYYRKEMQPLKEEEIWHEAVLGKGKTITSLSLYGEDDWTIAPWLKANLGLRYTLVNSDGKTRHSVEPRVSARFLLAEGLALKASYSRMSQDVHQLMSGNLAMPSELWIPITEHLPLMRSDQVAAGLAYEPWKGWSFTLEGYYKWQHNVIDYRDGVSYMTATGDWEEMITVGDGRSYGVEAMVQKRLGATTGWVSYTWSKAFRQYDRLGAELNGGKEFYALNDRRHNVSVVLSHRFNKHWEVSAMWTYQSGRRGNLATTALLTGQLDEYDPSLDMLSSSAGFYQPGFSLGLLDKTHLQRFLRKYSYYERNGYRLPASHRLDVGVTYTLRHRRCASAFNLTIYNVYNRQNVSNAYVGYDKNEVVVKGVCVLPFMPSLSYTISF